MTNAKEKNMAGEIVVPSLGESVTEATVAKWFKKIGDAVKQDEPLLELETDKVTLEVNAPASGVLKEIKIGEGKTVEVGTLLGLIEVGAAGAKSAPAASGSKPKRKACARSISNPQNPAPTNNPARRRASCWRKPAFPPPRLPAPARMAA